MGVSLGRKNKTDPWRDKQRHKQYNLAGNLKHLETKKEHHWKCTRTQMRSEKNTLRGCSGLHTVVVRSAGDGKDGEGVVGGSLPAVNLKERLPEVLLREVPRRPEQHDADVLGGSPLCPPQGPGRGWIGTASLPPPPGETAHGQRGWVAPQLRRRAERRTQSNADRAMPHLQPGERGLRSGAVARAAPTTFTVEVRTQDLQHRGLPPEAHPATGERSPEGIPAVRIGQTPMGNGGCSIKLLFTNPGGKSVGAHRWHLSPLPGRWGQLGAGACRPCQFSLENGHFRAPAAFVAGVCARALPTPKPDQGIS